MDVRPGGAFRAVMQLPDGNRIDWAGTYVEVEPPSHLAMTLTDQPGDDAGLPVLFDLEEVDGGTQLTIRQDRSDFTDEQVAATIAGYNAFIDDIERVARGDAVASEPSQSARAAQRAHREHAARAGALARVGARRGPRRCTPLRTRRPLPSSRGRRPRARRAPRGRSPSCATSTGSPPRLTT